MLSFAARSGVRASRACLHRPGAALRSASHRVRATAPAAWTRVAASRRLVSTTTRAAWAASDDEAVTAADAVDAAAATLVDVEVGADGAASTTLSAAEETLTSLFNSMDYGPAPENSDYANAWLDAHDRRFGMFVNNKWVQPEGRSFEAVTNPSNGEQLAEVMQANNDDVDMAVEAAAAAQPGWASLSPHARARHLYSLARHLQKHHRLMAVLESMDNGKTVRETRDADVPLGT